MRETPRHAAWRVLKWLLAVGTYYSGLLWLLDRLTPRGIRILAYHRVEPQRLDDGMTVSRPVFEAQLRHLKQRYRVIPLDDVATLLTGECLPARGLVVITCDDGYRDNYEVAWPLLKRYGLPATIFLTVGGVDRSLPLWTETLREAVWRSPEELVNLHGAGLGTWPLRVEADRLACFRGLSSRLKTLPEPARQRSFATALQSLGWSDGPANGHQPMLTWDMVREMRQSGVSVGAHTLSHPILARLSDDEARHEIVESKHRIEEELGEPIRHFAYPNGAAADWNPRTRDMVRAAGLDTAVTTIPGSNRRGRDRYALRRIEVNDAGCTNPFGRFSPALFEARLVSRALAAGAIATMGVRTEIVRTIERGRKLQPHWDGLRGRSGRHAVFLTPEWMLTWWEVYGGRSGLFLVAVWADDDLVGLLPTYVTGPQTDPADPPPRQLRLLASTNVYSDHLDGLAQRGQEREVVAAWRSAVRSQRSLWDSVELADLDTEGLLWRALREEPHAWDDGLALTERPTDGCPFTALPGSWEAYLGGLSAKSRAEIRHDRRALDKVGKVTVRAVTERHGVDEALATLIRLHHARRESQGKVGGFRDGRLRSFHRRASERFAERGWLRLWLLDVDGSTVAARYQFPYRGCVHDFLPGHDPAWDRYSVGLVLLSHCVEQAILSGDHEMDFLRGNETYKARWAPQVRAQATLSGARRFSGSWARHLGRGAEHRLRRAVTRALPAPVVRAVRRRLSVRRSSSRSKARFVPFYPSTAPRHLLGPRWQQPRPFPLDEPRAHHYYFARNGIWHAIDLLGLTPDDEVLMPAYNNGMEVAPFQRRGIPLRFVDVDRHMRLRLDDLKAKITSRTRVVYIIHYLGVPQSIEDIQAICRQHGLVLFEDCALAFGSSLGGRPLGSFGDLAVFCLPKFLPVPNGGILVLNNPDLGTPPPTRTPSSYSVASQLATKMLDHLEAHGGRWAAMTRGAATGVARRLVRAAGLRRVDSGVMQFLVDKVDWDMSGVSERILARVDYDAVYEKRRRNYLALHELVRDIPGVAPLQPALPEGVCPLFLPVLVDDNQFFARALIQSRICGGGFWSWFPPGVPVAPFPDSAFLRTHVLELQIHQDLELEHLAATARALERIMKDRP